VSGLLTTECLQMLAEAQALGLRAIWMMADPNELWVLTWVVDSTSDPYWNTSQTIIASPAKLSSMFNLHRLPYGARLLKGKQAARFIKWSAKQEARYRREQDQKRKMDGQN
jgi:hypothetical protein